MCIALRFVACIPVVTKALPSQAVVCSAIAKLLPRLIPRFFRHRRCSETAPTAPHPEKVFNLLFCLILAEICIALRFVACIPVVTKALPSQAVVCSAIAKLLPRLIPRFFRHRRCSETARAAPHPDRCNTELPYTL